MHTQNQNKTVEKDSKSEILQAALNHVIDLQEILRAAVTMGHQLVHCSLNSNAAMIVSEMNQQCETKYAVNVDGVSKEDKRRALHRAVERRRTNRINDLINQMKAILVAENGKATKTKSNKSIVLSDFLVLLQELGRQVVSFNKVENCKFGVSCDSKSCMVSEDVSLEM